LVLGFTFSSASNHYDEFLKGVRMQTNSAKELYISTKYLQAADQPTIKKSLADLIDFRLVAYQEIHTKADIDFAVDKTAAQVRKIIEDLTKAVANAPPEYQLIIANIVAPEMQNFSTIFSLSGLHARSHPTKLLMRFFYLLLCVGALLIGYTMAVKRENDWFLSFLYVLLMGFGFYVIFSLEFPNLLMPAEETNRDLIVLRDWMRSH